MTKTFQPTSHNSITVALPPRPTGGVTASTTAASIGNARESSSAISARRESVHSALVAASGAGVLASVDCGCELGPSRWEYLNATSFDPGFARNHVAGDGAVGVDGRPRLAADPFGRTAVAAEEALSVAVLVGRRPAAQARHGCIARGSIASILAEPSLPCPLCPRGRRRDSRRRFVAASRASASGCGRGPARRNSDWPAGQATCPTAGRSRRRRIRAGLPNAARAPATPDAPDGCVRSASGGGRRRET